MRLTRTIGALTAASLLLAVAACGSDDDGAGATSPPGTEAPAATDPKPEATTPEATDAAPATDAPPASDAAPATDAPDATEAPADDAALEQLIADAQAEGSLTVYSALTEAHMDQMAEGFADTYGIELEYQRLIGPDLTARYAAEAEAGAFAADVALLGSSPDATAADWISKGWVEPLADAGLPAYEGFPDEFKNVNTAVISLQPWGIIYNTDMLDDAVVPTSFEDLTDPSFSGQILIADPRATNAYLPIYTAIQVAYGDEWFTAMTGQDLRWFEGGTPASQALAAGEGSVMALGVSSQAFGLQAEGAPVEIAIPDMTAGVETHVALTSADDAPHPAAARLFAQWLMTPEGAEFANDINGVFSAYSEGLPADYQRPAPDTWLTPEQLLALFGLS